MWQDGVCATAFQRKESSSRFGVRLASGTGGFPVEAAFSLGAEGWVRGQVFQMGERT